MLGVAILCLVSAAAVPHAGAAVLRKRGWAGAARSVKKKTGPKMDWWVDKGHTGLTVTENNLGGHGPLAGPQRLRFNNVSLLHSLEEGHPASATDTSYHSDSAIYLDLLVTMISPYAKSGPVKRNGAEGDIGRIAIKKKMTETMKFQFVRHGTEEAWEIPEFDFTIFDIDQSAPTSFCCERIQGWQVHNVSMLDNAYSTVTNNEDHVEVCSNNVVKTGEVTNPTYIRTLSNAQARASVMFNYRDTSEFYLTMTNTCKGPRPFMFAGSADALTPPNGSWHAHFVPPYVELLPNGFSKDYYWELNKPATVTSNNLGHRGPIFTDPPEIRFEGVGVLVTTNETNHTVDMRMLDLVIFTEDRYWASDFIIKNWNGQQGEFGEVGLSRQSEVRLIFTFVETGTNQSVLVPSFDFTLFDIDNMADTNLGEEYTVHGAAGYAVVDGHYTIIDDSERGKIHLKSWVTKDNGAIPNPTGLSVLTEDQYKCAVQVKFKDTARWEIDFKTTATTERALVFGGHPVPPINNTITWPPTASPTMAPTMSPTGSPTVSPTMSPTGSPTTATPTASPTNSPTTSSPTPSPTTGRPSNYGLPAGYVAPTPSPTAAPTTATTTGRTRRPNYGPAAGYVATASPTAAPTTTTTRGRTTRPSNYGLPAGYVAPTPLPTGAPTTTTGRVRTTSAPLAGYVAPTPAPPVPSTVFGDPHVTNRAGRRFDIVRADTFPFLVVPRGAGQKDAQLTIYGRVTERGKNCSGQMYLTNLSLSGRWLGAAESIELSTGAEEFDTERVHGLMVGPGVARRRSGMSVEEFRRSMPPRMANVTRYHPEAPEGVNKHVTTLVVRLYLGPTTLKISWEHQREKVGFSNSLMMIIYGLGKIADDVGGLLGSDNISAAITPSSNCGRAMRTARKYRKSMALVG